VRIRNIFCVIDPTADTQLALARAAVVARAHGATIHAYLVLPADEQDADREQWLEAQLAPYRAEGLEIETLIERNDNWRAAIAAAAERSGAELIAKSTYRRPAMRRWLLRNADHLLLKSARCPVLFVKTDPPADPNKARTVLVAVNVNANDLEREELREATLRYARTLVSEMNAELHVVNAFPNRMEFVHPPDLAKRFEIPRSHAHVGEGPAEEVIAQVCEDLENPTLVMGAVIRPGVKGMVLGNTAERILNSVPCNVLAVVRPGFAKLPPS
jgi:universal stress protein E